MSPSERPAGRPSRRAADNRRNAPLTAAIPLLEAAALATLDKLNRGVLLLDADAIVRFVNRAARRMVQCDRGLALRHRRLAFADATAAAAFDELLENGDGSLVLRLDGRGPERGACRVLVSPLGGQPAGEGYCVFIYEPHGGHRPLPSQVLRELYALTLAETRLANSLFIGRSLQKSASALGISLNTAKSTLKRVFAKCEVASQAELLQLLSLGPRTL
jgi:DNA-binding CsgD family transcriptional regulator